MTIARLKKDWSARSPRQGVKVQLLTCGSACYRDGHRRRKLFIYIEIVFHRSVDIRVPASGSSHAFCASAGHCTGFWKKHLCQMLSFLRCQWVVILTQGLIGLKAVSHW